jgi:hypothetical protein
VKYGRKVEMILLPGGARGGLSRVLKYAVNQVLISDSSTLKPIIPVK